MFSTNPIYRGSKQLPIHLTIYPPFFANTKEKPPIENPTVTSQFIPTLYKTRNVMFVSTRFRALIPILNPVNAVVTFLPHFSEIHFHTYYNLCQYHSSCVFPSSFPPKIPHGHLSLNTCVTLPTIPLSFGSNAVTKLLGMEYATVPSYLPYQVRIFNSTSGKFPTYVLPSVYETMFTSVQNRK